MDVERGHLLRESSRLYAEAQRLRQRAEQAPDYEAMKVLMESARAVEAESGALAHRAWQHSRSAA